MKVFKEEQRMLHGWVYIVLILSILAPCVFMLGMMFEAESNRTDMLLAGGGILLLMAVVFGLINAMKLSTRIDELGLFFKFSPFHRSFKEIQWSAIKHIELKTYRPILDYGGWGLRTRGLKRWRKGVAYTVRGNKGIQLELHSGKKILIGTQKTEEAGQVLQTYQHKIKSNV